MTELTKGLNWTVVIPAYNEELTIRLLVENILQQQPTHLIVINDCSTDKTEEQLHHLPITVINNSKNLGKAGSLWRGFEHAIDLQTELIISIDGDGQHDPEDIPELIKKHMSNKDMIIIGSRKRNPDSQPFARYFANKFANFWISWAAGYRISDSQSGFRLYPVDLLNLMKPLKKSQGFVFESEILIEAAWHDYYSTSIEIAAIYHEKRRASHFNPLKDIMSITRMVTRRLIQKNMNLSGLYAIIKNKKPSTSN